VYYNILGLTRHRGRKPERLMPKIKRDLILVFCRIQLILILKSNKVIVKKALVCLCKQLKKLPNNTKIIKKEHKIVLIACISCCWSSLLVIIVYYMQLIKHIKCLYTVKVCRVSLDNKVLYCILLACLYLTRLYA
jgi:hypothetical protein